MATKSKKYKGIFLVKTLCIILAALCAGILSFFLVYFYEADWNGYINDPAKSWNDPLPPFEQSEQMEKLLDSDLYCVSLILKNSDVLNDISAVEAKKDEVVQANVERYLNAKAQIIYDELYYVATHYEGTGYDLDTDDFSANQTTTHTAVTPPEQPEEESAEAGAVESTAVQFEIDDHAPYNARYCQRLLNTVSGLDLLKYAYLVREQAFCEQMFIVNFSAAFQGSVFEGRESGFLTQGFDYTQNANEVQQSIESCFDDLLSMLSAEQADQYNSALRALHNEPSSLRYLSVSENGTILSNDMPADQRNSASILSHKNALICKQGKVTAKGAFQTEQLQSSAQTLFSSGAVYLYLEDTFCLGDKYYSAAAFYDLFTPFTPLNALLICAAALLLLLVCVCFLLALCGHKSGAEGIRLCRADKIPTDLHLLLSGSIDIALVYVFCNIFRRSLEMKYCWNGIWYSFSDTAARWEMKCIALAGMALTAAAFVLVFLEWLTSVVRMKKAHESWFRHCVLWKIPVLLWKGAKKIFGWILGCCRKMKKQIVFLLGKPKKIRYTALGVILAFFAAQLIVFVCCAADDKWGTALFLSALLWGSFAVLCIWYLRMIDSIIEASCDRSALPVKGTDKMPAPLKTLADNLTVTSQELDVAVADAVRNERTKAELITNVSHDLKTPLTSVISYVDLLKKCDITDEKAIGYLDILDEKSAKLKKLIEDLIEASKVNTGNVKLQIVPLNLSELAMQAVVEATPDFEKQALDIRFAQPDISPIVFVDGTKTYRILENLLSNAKKYSAPGSRVYVRVADEEKYGIFEIKNISKEPLDLTPNELTERFVRGDRSRSEDGNGLGLSIAQQLCNLQGGELTITIDGDLFKATVRLPKEK